jgi:hypothetical protein
MTKRITVRTKEYWIKKGLTEEEASKKIHEFSCWCKEYWIKKGLTEEEASKKIKEIQKENNKKVNQKTKPKAYETKLKLLQNDGLTEEEAKLYVIKNIRKNSCWCKEYWIKKGLTEEEASKKIKEIQTNNALKVDNKNKTKPYEIKTWIDRGLSEKEAEEKINQIKDSQNIYKIFSEKKLNDVISKRNHTYYSKTKTKRQKINKSRGKTKQQLIEKFGKEYVRELCLKRGKSRQNSFYRRYSKISEKFFNELQKNINEELFYGEKEKWIKYNKNKGFYVDLLYNNKIIEFNGNFYHANPKYYNEDSIIKISKENIKIAKEIWRKDKFKIDTLTKLNYKVMIIWEDEINNEDILNKCIKFLQNE